MRSWRVETDEEDGMVGEDEIDDDPFGACCLGDGRGAGWWD
jgi:hypothetical protein